MTEIAETPTVEQLVARLADLNDSLAVADANAKEWTQTATRLKASREDIKTQIVALLGKGGKRVIWADDGTKVATVAVPEPSTYVRVADTAAYAEWVTKNHPDQVEIIKQVRPVFKDALIADGTVTAEGLITKDGELVPGLELTEKKASPRLTIAPEGIQYLRKVQL